MRDTTPPSPPAFTGIREGATLRKLPRRIGCTSSDATSGIASCETGRLSRKPGRHRLLATATDVSGLTALSSLTYTFRPPSASRLAIPKRQSLTSVLSAGLRCTLRTAERRTKVTAVLTSGSTVLGTKTTRSKRAGRMALRIPLRPTGQSALRGTSRAKLSVTVTAMSRNTRRAKLRAARSLRR